MFTNKTAVDHSLRVRRACLLHQPLRIAASRRTNQIFSPSDQRASLTQRPEDSYRFMRSRREQVGFTCSREDRSPLHRSSGLNHPSRDILTLKVPSVSERERVTDNPPLIPHAMISTFRINMYVHRYVTRYISVHPCVILVKLQFTFERLICGIE